MTGALTIARHLAQLQVYVAQLRELQHTRAPILIGIGAYVQQLIAPFNWQSKSSSVYATS